jgi:flagellar basal body-associated protein FliL
MGLLIILIYIALIIAAFSVAIAIWRGMKAQERMADSIERIEKIIERDQTRL